MSNNERSPIPYHFKKEIELVNLKFIYVYLNLLLFGITQSDTKAKKTAIQNLEWLNYDLGSSQVIINHHLELIRMQLDKTCENWMDDFERFCQLVD